MDRTTGFQPGVFRSPAACHGRVRLRASSPTGIAGGAVDGDVTDVGVHTHFSDHESNAPAADGSIVIAQGPVRVRIVYARDCGLTADPDAVVDSGGRDASRRSAARRTSS